MKFQRYSIRTNTTLAILFTVAISTLFVSTELQAVTIEEIDETAYADMAEVEIQEIAAQLLQIVKSAPRHNAPPIYFISRLLGNLTHACCFMFFTYYGSVLLIGAIDCCMYIFISSMLNFAPQKSTFSPALLHNLVSGARNAGFIFVCVQHGFGEQSSLRHSLTRVFNDIHFLSLKFSQPCETTTNKLINCTVKRLKPSSHTNIFDQCATLLSGKVITELEIAYFQKPFIEALQKDFHLAAHISKIVADQCDNITKEDVLCTLLYGESNSCGICFGEYDETTKRVIVRCGHHFCTTCINKNRKQKCWYCHKPISEKYKIADF